MIARHIERQRWNRTRELAVDLLLNQNHLQDADPAGQFFIRLVEHSEDWDQVPDLIDYLDQKLQGNIPTTIGDWRMLAEEWEEELRRMLVSDF